MLPAAIEDKLQYFDKEKYETSCTEVILNETKQFGQVILKCKLNKDTIIFHKPEENTLPYLNGKKKYATSCADSFLFELDSDGKWILHIMEFKKTITTASIKKSKIQIVMGIYNARAIAAFLNMHVKAIYIYSAYREDGIEKISNETLIQMRSANSDKKDLSIIKEWKSDKCTLVIDMEKATFEHNKIQLDAEGNGSCELKVS